MLITYFKQDNASLHISKLTKIFFQKRNINVLSWPTHYSPDLNPIENDWAKSRHVYKNGSQFKSK